MPFQKKFALLFLFFSVVSLTPIFAQSQKAVSGVKAQTEFGWQQDRKLTWADFKGRPNPSETKYALTTSDMNVGLNCDGENFTFTVSATFVPEESWTRSLDSDALLAHEQLHFDITELHARKLRKVLSSLPNGCFVPEKELQKLIDQAFADWHQMEDEYDRTTRHGLNKEAQLGWQKLITAALAQFDLVP